MCIISPTTTSNISPHLPHQLQLLHQEFDVIVWCQGVDLGPDGLGEERPGQHRVDVVFSPPNGQLRHGGLQQSIGLGQPLGKKEPVMLWVCTVGLPTNLSLIFSLGVAGRVRGVGGGVNPRCCGALLLGFPQTFHSFSAPGGKESVTLWGFTVRVPTNLSLTFSPWGEKNRWRYGALQSGFSQTFHSFSAPGEKRISDVVGLHIQGSHKPYTDNAHQQHTPANLHWQCPASPPPAHASAPSCPPRLPPGHRRWRDDQPGWCHAGTSAASSGGGWRHRRWRTLRDCCESSLLCRHAWQWAGHGGCWAADRSNLWKVKLSMQQHITMVLILGGEGWDQTTNTKCLALTKTEQIT